jgi:hypothetical protein
VDEVQISFDRVAPGQGADMARAPLRRIRFLALVLASAALAGTALALVAAIAVHGGREARAFARGPVIADDDRGAIALWQGVRDAVDETPHDVIFIEPLVASAPPPPGLRGWPEPGEMYLSPALARAGAGEHIDTRYGRFAGLIGKPGLLTPSERLAYVRPARPPDGPDRQKWLPITGFGAPTVFGDATDSASLAEVLLAVGVFLGVPTLVLLWTAVRHVRPCDRGLGAIVPILLGTLLAAVPLVVALCTPVTLPITGYVLAPTDLRAAWPWAVCAVAVSSALAFGAVAVARPRTDRVVVVRKRRAVVCGVAMLVVAASSYFPGTTGLLVFGVSTLGLWLTLPTLMAWAARRFAPSAPPAAWARTATTVAIGVGLVCLSQTWAGRIGEHAELAGAIKRHSGDHVLIVDSTSLTPQGVDAFVRALPAGVQVLGLGTVHETGDIRLTGPCEAVRELGAPCSITAVPLPTGTSAAEGLRAWYGKNTGVRIGAVTEGTGQLQSLVVVMRDDRRDDIERIAHETLLFPEVGTPGDTWLLGAHASVVLGRWLLLSTSASLVLLLVAASLGAVHDLLRSRPSAWRLALTTTAAVLCGLTVAWWHAQFFVVVLSGSRLRWDSAVSAGWVSWAVALTIALTVWWTTSPPREPRRT